MLTITEDVKEIFYIIRTRIIEAMYNGNINSVKELCKQKLESNKDVYCTQYVSI